MRAFDNNVNETGGGSLKPAMPTQMCVGWADKVIESRDVTKPSSTYKRARELLDSRIDISYSVVDALFIRVRIDKVISLNDSDGIKV